MQSAPQHSPNITRQARAPSKHQVRPLVGIYVAHRLQQTACCFAHLTKHPPRSLATAVLADDAAGFLFSWGLDAQYRLGRQSEAEADAATPQITLPQLEVRLSSWQTVTAPPCASPTCGAAAPCAVPDIRMAAGHSCWELSAGWQLSPRTDSVSQHTWTPHALRAVLYTLSRPLPAECAGGGHSSKPTHPAGHTQRQRLVLWPQ
jgi:hypothetical protein